MYTNYILKLKMFLNPKKKMCYTYNIYMYTNYILKLKKILNPKKIHVYFIQKLLQLHSKTKETDFLEQNIAAITCSNDEL